MTKVDARLFRKARLDIREALAELIDPTLEQWGSHSFMGPSLMTQLRIEVANSSNRGVGRSGNVALPFNPDAYDLLIQIAKWANSSTSTIETQLHSYVARMLAVAHTDLSLLINTAEALRAWANAIHALINPLRRYHIAKPCPRCNSVMAWRKMPNGERLQTHALVVDGTRGCECQACGAFWPTTHLEHLARVLGCEPLPGAVISDTIPAP